MRKIFWTIFSCWLLALAVRADTFQLTDGTAITGDIVSFNDTGIIFRTPDDKYTDRMPWTKFSQDSLKQLGQNPKIEPLVDPFIEIPASERPKKPEIKIQDVSRLEQPQKQSLLGALFASSVGLFALLLIYAANLYAGYEIAAVRARPIAQVMGVAAVLPILGPIIFLSMPMHVAAAAEAQPEAEAQTFAVAGQTARETTAISGGAHIAQTSSQKSAHPETQVFQRGQFMFNRRFFETKFSGFFSVVRREAEKDLVLVVKTMRGQFEVKRVTRIAANDIHFEVAKGSATSEVMVPFAEIQEIQLKHKDA
ncbi:MAG: hypothetical protein ABSG87_03580 [Verrucomicrobiota bacterium]